MDLSLGAYHLPVPGTGVVNSEIARLDFNWMPVVICGDSEIADAFCSGQPHHHISTDLWSSKSKVPFAGLDSNYAHLRGDHNEQRRGPTLGLIHMPGRHGGEKPALKIAGRV